MKGTFKWYNTEKGYGFIKEEESGDEYFVHYTQLPENQGNIKEADEQRVDFEPQETQRGKQAVDVTFLDLEEKESKVAE
ncbi:MAG: cold-shock protein [Candidatus Nanoarchaeia archaeon]